MMLAQAPLASVPLAAQGGASSPSQDMFSAVWSLPVRQKIAPRLAIALAASGLIAPVLEPNTQIIQTYESCWHQGWSTPVWHKPAVIAAEQAFFYFPPEPPIFDTVDWLTPFNEPVRQKKGLGSWLQQSFTQDTQPVPTSRGMGWFRPLETPVRVKLGVRAPNQPFQTLGPFPPEEAMLTWYKPLETPVRLKKGIGAWLQQYWNADTSVPFGPASNLDAFQSWVDPVRLPRGLKAWLQQFFAYHPRILPNPDVTLVMSAVETNNDVALFGVYVTNPIAPVTTGTSANVSIVEVPTENNAAASLRET